MSAPEFWNDPDGTWFQIDAQTFGPFDSEADAEKSADTILSAGPFDAALPNEVHFHNEAIV